MLGTTYVEVNGTTAKGGTLTWTQNTADFPQGELNGTTVDPEGLVLSTIPIKGKFGGCAFPTDEDSWIYYTQGNINTRSQGTVEMWIKYNELPVNGTRIFEGIEYWGGQYQPNMHITFNVTDGILRYGYNTLISYPNWVWNYLDVPIPSVGEWHHIACQWGGDGCEFFVDGKLEDTNSWTGSNYLTEAVSLGSRITRNPKDTAMVYIDDFRFSTVQVYSSEFTPPTEPLTRQSGTVFIDHLDNDTIGNNNGYLFVEPALNGTFNSTIHDTGAPHAIIRAAGWTADIPQGCSMDVQVRSCNIPNMTGATPWTDIVQGPTILDTYRYIQYSIGLCRTSSAVPILRSFSITYGGVVEVMASLDGSKWTRATGTYSWTVELELHEGIVPIYVAAYDVTHNITIAMVTVVVDLSPPTLRVEIDDGSTYTTKGEVSVRVEAWDNNTVTHMRFSERADLSGSTWLVYKPEFTYDLGDVNGNRTLYVAVRDIAGHESSIASDSIILDTVKPIGTLVVGDGSGISLTQLADIAVEAYDDNGVAYMRAGDLSDVESRAWAPYRETSKLDLGPREGFHTVCVDVRDGAGNVLRLLAELILDLHAPTVEISIEDGSEVVSHAVLSVSVSALDANGVVEMRRADSQDGLQGAAWRELEASYTVDLGDGDHSHTEWLEVRDAAGRTAVASDSVVVDQTPPAGSIAIEDGAPFIHWNLVNLTIELTDATSGVDRFRLANDPSFTGSQWMAPRSAMKWELQRGDGNRTVYMEVRDEAGLVSSLEAAVLVVTTPPKGFAWATKRVYGSTDITLGLEWDRATSMWVFESPKADGPWLPVNASPVIRIAAGDGSRTVHVRIQDQYGLLSEVMSVSFILDTTSPDVAFTSPVAGDKLKTLMLTISGVADDDNGLTRIDVRVDDGEWLPMPNQTLWTHVVDLGKWGEHTVTVRAEDVVGNQGEATIAVKAEEPLEVSTPASSILLALALLICITAVVVVWMLLRSRRPPEASGPGTPLA